MKGTARGRACQECLENRELPRILNEDKRGR